MNLRNRYILMRHGEAASNIRGTLSSFPETFRNSLTDKGKECVRGQAKKLKRLQISFVISSPLLRARQTARAASAELGVPVHYDRRLREIDFGELNGASEKRYDRFSREESLTPREGESLLDVEKRTEKFVRSVERKYSRKRILIVGHGAPLRILARVLARHDPSSYTKRNVKRSYQPRRGLTRKARQTKSMCSIRKSTLTRRLCLKTGEFRTLN